MGRTYNRYPESVNINSLNEDYFNIAEFHGINSNKNYIDVDQYSFVDAENMYVDQNNQLSTRPPLALFAGTPANISEIIKVYSYGDYTFYHVLESAETYKLYVYYIAAPTSDGSYTKIGELTVTNEITVMPFGYHKWIVFTETGILGFEVDNTSMTSLSSDDLINIPVVAEYSGAVKNESGVSNIFSQYTAEDYLVSKGTANEFLYQLNNKTVQLMYDVDDYTDDQFTYTNGVENTFRQKINNANIPGTELQIAENGFAICKLELEPNQTVPTWQFSTNLVTWVNIPSLPSGTISPVSNFTDLSLSDDGGAIFVTGFNQHLVYVFRLLLNTVAVSSDIELLTWEAYSQHDDAADYNCNCLTIGGAGNAQTISTEWITSSSYSTEHVRGHAPNADSYAIRVPCRWLYKSNIQNGYGGYIEPTVPDMSEAFLGAIILFNRSTITELVVNDNLTLVDPGIRTFLSIDLSADRIEVFYWRINSRDGYRVMFDGEFTPITNYIARSNLYAARSAQYIITNANDLQAITMRDNLISVLRQRTSTTNVVSTYLETATNVTGISSVVEEDPSYLELTYNYTSYDVTRSVIVLTPSFNTSATISTGASAAYAFYSNSRILTSDVVLFNNTYAYFGKDAVDKTNVTPLAIFEDHYVYQLSNGDIYTTNYSGQYVLRDVIEDTSFEYKRPNFVISSTNYEFAIGPYWYHSAATEDGKLYVPSDSETDFDDDITYLIVFNQYSTGVFLEDAVYEIIYSESDGLYRKYPTKLQLGCKNGANVLSGYDGATMYIATLKGINALTYQDFVQSTEQIYKYLTEPLMSDYYMWAGTNPINLYQYKDWLFVYKKGFSSMYVFDLRSATWWSWTVPTLVQQIIKINQELYFLCKTGDDYAVYLVDFDSMSMRDADSSSVITWKFTTQKLHFGYPNNYKHVRQVAIVACDDFDRQRYKMTFKIYNNINNSRQFDTVEYDIDQLQSCIERVNFVKVSAFQLSLQSDPTDTDPSPFKTPNIAIKYRVTERLR